MRSKFSRFIFAGILALLGVNFLSSNTFAASEAGNAAIKKAYINMVDKCLEADSLQQNVDLNKIKTINGLISFKAGSTNVFVPAMTPEDLASNTGKKVSCKTFLTDAFTVSGASATIDGNLLTAFGYKKSDKQQAAGEKCIDFTATEANVIGGDSKDLVKICFDKDGKVSSSQKLSGAGSDNYSLKRTTRKHGKGDVFDGYEFYRNDKKYCETKVMSLETMRFIGCDGYTIAGKDSTVISTQNYELGSDASANAKKLRKYLGGEGYSREFSDINKYYLYMSYASDVYGASVKDGEQCQKTKPSNVATNNEFYLPYQEGWCRVKIGTEGNKHKKVVPALAANGKYYLSRSLDFEGLVKAIGALSVPKDQRLSVSGYSADVGKTLGGDIQKEEFKRTCGNSAGAMSWMICPAIEALSSVMNKGYDWIEKNFLEIKISFFNPDDDGGARVMQAWEVIRSIANVFFIILFLIVIFSQLTGYGIDNYGIKKALPRLLVAAILINISFFVTQLAVDLANIVGAGITQFFNSLTDSNSITAFGQGQTIDDTAAQHAAELGGVFLLGITVASVWASGLAIIISLLMSLLSGAIAVFMMMIILAARQAGVIIAVVFSPLAFAAYILPNTRPLFKRWFSIFKGLLLVYPLCGLVIGGSRFVASILNSTLVGSDPTGFMGIIVVALSVVPFFFVPTLLKNSLSGMGNLGAKLSGIGNNISRRATSSADSAIRGSRAFKNYEENRRIARDQRYAKRVLDNFAASGKDVSKLSAGARRRLNRAAALGASIGKEEAATKSALAEYNDINSAAGQEALRIATERKVASQAVDTRIQAMTAAERQPEAALARIKEINSLAKSENRGLTEEEKLSVKARATVLTSSGFGSKLLAGALRNESGTDGIEGPVNDLVSEMAGKSPEFAGAVAKKDGYLNQYYNDRNSGKAFIDGDATKGNMSFEEWANSVRSDGRTNKQFVSDEILTKDIDVLGQSSRAAKDFAATASNDRLQAIIDSDDFYSTGVDNDVRDVIIQAANSRGLVAAKDTPQRVILEVPHDSNNS